MPFIIALILMFAPVQHVYIFSPMTIGLHSIVGGQAQISEDCASVVEGDLTDDQITQVHQLGLRTTSTYVGQCNGHQLFVPLVMSGQ